MIYTSLNEICTLSDNSRAINVGYSDRMIVSIYALRSYIPFT